MDRISRRRSVERSRNISNYRPALERIGVFLEEAYPDLEGAKIERVIELLFGPHPEITDFSFSSPAAFDPAS
jgi:hypothetical protein